MITMFAELTFEFTRDFGFGFHGDFTCEGDVAMGESW